MVTSNDIAREKLAKELEDELMKYTINYDEKEVHVHSNVQTDEVQIDVAEEVNITECTNSGGRMLVKRECMDTTESSSSFDGSNCEVENADALDDYEASSDFHGNDASRLGFQGFGEISEMRKKKLTAHWRTYIQPLRWRCKWIELQIKKLEDQAKKYERKLEELNQPKHVQFDESTLEVGIKSLPCSQNRARNEVLPRKKRRRIEAMEDTAAHMSRHVIFSYYEKNRYLSMGMDYGRKNPENITQRFSIEDESCGHDEQLLCDKNTKDDKNIEDICRKITSLQSQVGKLRSRVGKLMRENSDKFAHFDKSMLSPQNNALDSSPPNAADTPTNQRRMPMYPHTPSQPMLRYSINGVPVSRIAVMRVLLGENGNKNHVWSADAYENEDDILISNLKAKEVMQLFEEVKVPPMQRPDGHLTSTGTPVVPPRDQPPQNMRFMPKMGSRVNKVMRENAEDFSRNHNPMLPVQNNALASSPQNTAYTPNGGNPTPMSPYIASQPMSGYNMNYAPASKSIAMCHQPVVPSSNRNADHAYFPRANGNYLYDIKGGNKLISNPRVKEAPNTLEQVKVQRPNGQPSCSADAPVTTEVAMPTDGKREQKIHSSSKLIEPKGRGKRTWKGASK